MTPGSGDTGRPVGSPFPAEPPRADPMSQSREQPIRSTSKDGWCGGLPNPHFAPLGTANASITGHPGGPAGRFAASIRHDLLTLAGLPGQESVRRTYLEPRLGPDPGPNRPEAS